MKTVKILMQECNIPEKYRKDVKKLIECAQNATNLKLELERQETILQNTCNYRTNELKTMYFNALYDKELIEQKLYNAYLPMYNTELYKDGCLYCKLLEVLNNEKF